MLGEPITVVIFARAQPVPTVATVAQASVHVVAVLISVDLSASKPVL